MDSIIQNDRTRCYLCDSCRWLEEHHVFGGYANRKHSEKYGLKVYLCHYCHNEPPDGVHYDKKKMDKLRETGQRYFEMYYPEEDFKKIFGVNYL